MCITTRVLLLEDSLMFFQIQFISFATNNKLDLK